MQARRHSVCGKAHEVHPGLKTVVLSATDRPSTADRGGLRGRCIGLLSQDGGTGRPDGGNPSRIRGHHYLAHSKKATALREPVASVETPDLTRRELEILQLVAEEYSNSQLAKMLWVTEQTVKFHLSNIYRKLGVVNRTEASR